MTPEYSQVQWLRNHPISDRCLICEVKTVDPYSSLCSAHTQEWRNTQDWQQGFPMWCLKERIRFLVKCL